MPWSRICKASANMHRGEAEMISGIVTLVLLVMFVGAWIWVWSPRRKPEFDAAARLPLEESSAPAQETQR